MKKNVIFILSVFAAFVFFSGCQGDESNDPDFCYFILGFSATDCGDCCDTGSVGFDIVFCDEAGQTYQFGPYTVPQDNNQLLGLPSGHQYVGHVINNGNQTGGCILIPELEITIIAANNEDPFNNEAEECFVYTTSINERPEIYSCESSPDLTFELADFCDGCNSISIINDVECCMASLFVSEVTPNPQGGVSGDLILNLLGEQDCENSVDQICIQAAGGVMFQDFNGSSSGCVDGYQDTFHFTSSNSGPFNIQATISFNNGCDDQVLLALYGDGS